MEQIKKILSLLDERYGRWMWLITRVIMCVIVVNVCIYALTIFALAVCPFVFLLMGDGFVGFLAWYYIPALLPITWIFYDIAKFIYDEYIDIYDY